MDSADVLYAATQLLFPTCNIMITAESYRPRLGMYEVSKLQAWEVHSLKVIITLTRICNVMSSQWLCYIPVSLLLCTGGSVNSVI